MFAYLEEMETRDLQYPGIVVEGGLLTERERLELLWQEHAQVVMIERVEGKVRLIIAPCGRKE